MSSNSYNIFLSYAKADFEEGSGRIDLLVKLIGERLKNLVGAECRFHIDAADSVRSEMRDQDREDMIMAADILIPVLTPSYLGSGARDMEISSMIDRNRMAGGRVLLPIYYKDYNSPRINAGGWDHLLKACEDWREIRNFSDWSGNIHVLQAFSRLTGRIAAFLHSSPESLDSADSQFPTHSDRIVPDTDPAVKQIFNALKGGTEEERGATTSEIRSLSPEARGRLVDLVHCEILADDASSADIPTRTWMFYALILAGGGALHRETIERYLASPDLADAETKFWILADLYETRSDYLVEVARPFLSPSQPYKLWILASLITDAREPTLHHKIRRDLSVLNDTRDRILREPLVTATLRALRWFLFGSSCPTFVIGW